MYVVKVKVNLSLCRLWRHMGEGRYSSKLSQAWHRMEVSGQLDFKATPCCYTCGTRRLGSIKLVMLNFFTFDQSPLSIYLSLSHTHTHMQSPMCSVTKLQQMMGTMYSSSSVCKMLFLYLRAEMSTRPITRNNFSKCCINILKKGVIAYYHFPYMICFPLIIV
jgi:hypothetical protein